VLREEKDKLESKHRGKLLQLKRLIHKHDTLKNVIDDYIRMSKKQRNISQILQQLEEFKEPHPYYETAAIYAVIITSKQMTWIPLDQDNSHFCLI
jgi:hypothetical protein